MNIEEYREYCLVKKGVTESFPFDNNTLVFKVMGKMFALSDINTFVFINLKCDPERAIELREEHEGIKAGYHMSKKHWNSCYIESDLSDTLLYELIDHSYNLIVNKLTRTLKEELNTL